MPRKYKPDPRAKRHLKPVEEDLQKAIADVDAKKLSLRNAA